LKLFVLILLLLILSSTLAVNLVRFPSHPVTTAVLCTPELDEGVVFGLRGDRRVEVASGDLPGTFGRFFRRLYEARSEWRDGVLRVEGPPGVEVVLLVPDPEGFSVTEGSMFLEDGPLPEGACVLLGEVREDVQDACALGVSLPFGVARGTYYEYPDWVAHDWERRVSGGDESRGSRLQCGKCPGR